MLVANVKWLLKIMKGKATAHTFNGSRKIAAQTEKLSQISLVSTPQRRGSPHLRRLRFSGALEPPRPCLGCLRDGAATAEQRLPSGTVRRRFVGGLLPGAGSLGGAGAFHHGRAVTLKAAA